MVARDRRARVFPHRRPAVDGYHWNAFRASYPLVDAGVEAEDLAGDVVEAGKEGDGAGGIFDRVEAAQRMFGADVLMSSRRMILAASKLIGTGDLQPKGRTASGLISMRLT